MTSSAHASAARRGPGRPPSDAPDRILEAAYEVLKLEGYAGLTLAKVAAASDQNKALISYYYGSRQGLVAAVARHVSERITRTVLAAVANPAAAEDLVRGLAEGIWQAMDDDEGLQRVYFDLVSQAVVEPRVGEILREMKEGYRAILRELLRGLSDGPAPADLDGAAVFLIAGLEGLSMERLERGETPELERARAMFVESASAAISRSR